MATEQLSSLPSPEALADDISNLLYEARLLHYSVIEGQKAPEDYTVLHHTDNLTLIRIGKNAISNTHLYTQELSDKRWLLRNVYSHYSGNQSVACVSDTAIVIDSVGMHAKILQKKYEAPVFARGRLPLPKHTSADFVAKVDRKGVAPTSDKIMYWTDGFIEVAGKFRQSDADRTAKRGGFLRRLVAG
jgi:hypothetical protein